MTELRPPVRDLLAEKVDEAAIVRIWAGVNARRGGKRLGRRGSTRPAWFWGLAGATIGTLLLLLVQLPERAKTPSVADAALNGPLVSRAGRALAVLGGEPASNNELSDGSSIALSAGSRLEVLENTSKTFVSVLRSGQGSFSVRPSGPRRWTVEAGLATVEVVGTRFDVTRSGLGVEINVQHGVVLVRSELIQDRVQRLTAGQSLTIRADGALPTLANGDQSSAASLRTAPLSSSVEHASAAPSLEQLLTRADERRRLGDVSGAESALRLALSTHGNEPQAALAAFTLGKLLSDVAGRPGAAAEAFARCLALSPPSALAEDALYRLAETQAKAGDANAARASAQNYRARYPSGRHLEALSRWLSEH